MIPAPNKQERDFSMAKRWKCLLDMDGVLVDFVKGICELHQKEDPFKKGYQGWDMIAEFGMSPSEFWNPCGREFWKNLDWTEEGKEIVAFAEETFGTKNIALLTSPCATDGCIDGKMDWIKKNLPQFRRSFLVGPAKHFCAAPNHFLVDDHDGNIAEFNADHGNGILVPRVWNENRDKGEPLAYIKQRILSVIG